MAILIGQQLVAGEDEILTCFDDRLAAFAAADHAATHFFPAMRARHRVGAVVHSVHRSLLPIDYSLPATAIDPERGDKSSAADTAGRSLPDKPPRKTVKMSPGTHFSLNDPIGSDNRISPNY
jgi:hypothetical protein